MTWCFHIGQVVPHEVIGMANHNKNLFVGTGGPEGINKSHFLGAAYGMERIMGRADTPVRKCPELCLRITLLVDLPVSCMS
jgi:nickel-dependent lactate racemase